MVTISRKDLYEKLWSIGISKTAQELNVPHNKLKSACNSNDIPLPTQSYWSRLYMGKIKPTQPLLPNPTDNPEVLIEKIKIKSTLPTIKFPLKDDKEILSKTKIEVTSSKNEVPDKQAYFSYFDKNEQSLLTQIFCSLKVNKTISSKPHKEIVKYRQKKKDPDPYYKREAKLKINSSSGVFIPETLPFIDSLFKALDKANAKIVTTHDETRVLYKNYVFILNFRLPSNKVMLSPDDKEYSTYKTFKYVSTEKLNVEVGYYLEWRWHNHEKIIKQTKTDTFDDLLKKVFLYIFSLPQKIDEDIKTHQIEEEKKRQAEEQKAILKEKRDIEYKLTEELLKNSIHFFYSQLVKTYVASEIDESTEEYDWAMKKSNWIKDSDKHPDSILTTIDKERLIYLFRS